MKKAGRSVNWGKLSTTRSGYTIHRITARRYWNYQEHSHKGYGELVCVTHGELRQNINGTEFTQSAGDIIFVRESDSHSLRGSNFSYVNVMFAASWLKRLELYVDTPGLTDTLLASHAPPKATLPPRDATAMERDMTQLLKHSESLTGRRIFSQFLLNAVTRHLAPLHDHTFSDDLADWLRESLLWLSENRDKNPSLQELVKRSYRSHEHFTREFSRHMGTTPSRYLSDLKINHAAQMLLTTNNTLSEISEAAGFENESYFFRMFRRSKGCTPLAYRKTYGRNSIQKPPGPSRRKK